MGCLKGLLWLIAIFFGVAIVGALINGQQRSSPPASSVAVNAQPVVAKPTRPYADRLAETERTLAGFDFTGVETTDDIATSLAMIEVFASAATEIPTDEADKAARITFTKHLRDIQRRVLPVLRDKYGPALRQKLWEVDGKAKTIGQGYRTVEFIAAEFAANRNIKSFFETIYPSLMQLRFTRAQFKWFDLANEMQYYTLKPPSDDDIVTWSGGSYTQVWPMPAK